MRSDWRIALLAIGAVLTGIGFAGTASRSTECTPAERSAGDEKVTFTWGVHGRAESR